MPLRRSPRKSADPSATKSRTPSAANTGPQPKKRQRSQRTRQSPRGNAGFTELAQNIVGRRQNVVFITGAGLSVASGVRPFRTSGGGGGRKSTKPVQQRQEATETGFPPLAGIWDEVVYTTATRAAFRKDPLRWYNKFWIPHFYRQGSRTAVPNSGHFALDALLQENENIRQVTQNIDGLQPPGDRIVEAHGRLGLYRCLPDVDSDTESENDDNDHDNGDGDRPVQLGSRRKAANQRLSQDGVDTCPFQYQESLQEKDIEPDRVRSAIRKCRAHTANLSNRAHGYLPSPPRCSHCNNIVVPQALLFDEGYHSHSFYQFSKVEDWLTNVDILVFVGTSFAVQLAQTALDVARDRHLPVYNFNTSDLLIAGPRLNATNIVGPAAVTLSQLLATCRSLKDMPVATAAIGTNSATYAEEDDES